MVQSGLLRNPCLHASLACPVVYHFQYMDLTKRATSVSPPGCTSVPPSCLASGHSTTLTALTRTQPNPPHVGYQIFLSVALSLADNVRQTPPLRSQHIYLVHQASQRLKQPLDVHHIIYTPRVHRTMRRAIGVDKVKMAQRFGACAGFSGQLSRWGHPASVTLHPRHISPARLYLHCIFRSWGTWAHGAHGA